MPTTSSNKTVGRVLLAHTQLPSGAFVMGLPLTVATLQGPGLITVSWGRSVSTALTAAPAVWAQFAQSDNANDEWCNLRNFGYEPLSIAAVNATTLNGATGAGAPSFSVASATGLAVGQWLYLRETGTPANSEWCQVLSISGTTITPTEPLTRPHTNGITVTNGAERLTYPVDLSAVKRLRAAAAGFSAAGLTGQLVDVMVELATLDGMTV